MNSLELAERICEAIHSLPDEQLHRVLRFVEDLEKTSESDSTEETLAPLYGIHSAAVRTGISDL